MDATSKASTAVSKLVKLWENRQAQQAARISGLGLMAVSLAACGSSDDTPYSQAEVDELQEEIDDLEDEITSLEGEVSELEGEVDDLSDEIADLLAEVAATGFTDLTDLVTAYTALVTPVSRSFSLLDDALIGSAGNDTFTAAAGTVAATDSVTDTSTTDNDTINIVSSGAVAAFRSTNVENINITINSLAADAVDAANFTGARALSVTRGDVSIGGATLTGNKAVTINNVDASQIASISVGAGTTTVDINSAATDGAGHVLNLNSATGAVTVDGAATINAALATSVAIDAVSNTTAAETAKASTINAAVATTVTTHANLTGSITINAAAATTVTVNDAQGGVTINAATTHAADSTITVTDVDASGASITVGTGVDDATTAANIAIDISIDGTAALTDAATISGAGHIELSIDGAGAGQNVDIITLSGNGAAVVFDLAAPAAGTAVSFTKAGTQSVEIMGDASEFSGVTVTNIDIVDISAIAGGAADFDASLFSGVGLVDLGVNNGGAGIQITVANGQTWEITADQTTGLDFDFSTTTIGDLTVIAGDDNGADDPTVGTITVGAFNAAAGAATTTGTVTIEASMANFTATSTVLGAAQTLVVTGDEDVTLGAVTALAVNAANSSGIINMTAAADVATVATGSGADVIILNDATGGGAVVAHQVTTGAGNDTITVTATAATATIDAGAGNDAFTLTATTAYVVSGGEGNDTFTTATDIEAVILGGNGTDTFTVGATLDFSNNTQFALNSIETVNITAATVATLSAAQLAGNSTFAITADGDTLRINTTATGSVDGSGITISAGSTATISYVGSTGANAMTGGVEAETFQGGAGADTIVGGDGNDTFVAEGLTTETGSANASVGMIVNLGATAVTGASIFALTGDFLGGSVTSVAANTATHLYAANVAGNASVVDSLSSIENVTGGAGTDYIIGSVGANVITGGAGADFLTGGLGADTFVFTDRTAIDTVTDFVSTVDVVSLNGGAVAVNAVAVAGLVANGAATTLVFDTLANLGALGVTIGDQNDAGESGVQFAVASDTGAIFFDADGDWTAGSVQIGSLGAVALVSTDFVI